MVRPSGGLPWSDSGWSDSRAELRNPFDIVERELRARPRAEIERVASAASPEYTSCSPGCDRHFSGWADAGDVQEGGLDLTNYHRMLDAHVHFSVERARAALLLNVGAYFEGNGRSMLAHGLSRWSTYLNEPVEVPAAPRDQIPLSMLEPAAVVEGLSGAVQRPEKWA